MSDPQWLGVFVGVISVIVGAVAIVVTPVWSARYEQRRIQKDGARDGCPPLSIQADSQVLTEAVLAQWLTEAVLADGYGTRTSVLYAEFLEWCRGVGVPRQDLLTVSRWCKILTEVGYPSIDRWDGKYRGLVSRKQTS